MEELYINKVLNGDQQAFRYFIQHYKNMAYSIAISIVKDEFVAQEIVQDAFVKAYRNLRQFNKTSSFGTWFYRIVTNESLTFIRKSSKQISYFSTSEHDELPDDSVFPVLQDEEQSQMINQALQQMAPNESLALRLFYLQENSIKNVCEITGWAESNAKVILHRARKNMLLLLLSFKRKQHEQ